MCRHRLGWTEILAQRSNLDLMILLELRSFATDNDSHKRIYNEVLNVARLSRDLGYLERRVRR